MAYSKDKIRLSLAVDKELYDRLEFASKKLNMSKNNLIVTLVESNLDTIVKSWEILQNPIALQQMATVLGSQGYDMTGFDELNNALQDKNRKEFKEIDDFTKGITKKTKSKNK